MVFNLTETLSRAQKSWILFAIDIALIVVAYLLAALLLSGTEMWMTIPDAAAMDLAVVMGVGATMTALLGLHRLRLRAYQMQGVLQSALVALAMAVAGALVSVSVAATATPAHVFVVFGMVFLILTVSARLALRHWITRLWRGRKSRARLLIYGAGRTGQQLASALETDDAVMPVLFR